MQGLATRLSLATLTLALGLVLAAPALATPADAQATKAKATKAQATKAKATKAKGGAQKGPGGAKAPIAGGPEDETALWWNDPKIQKALSLSDEQRKKMVEYLTAYRKKVPPPPRVEVFHETLVQRNWKQAVSENKKLAERAETSVRMRGTLKIDILSVLTKEQHKTLIDRYPRLIYQPWTRAMRGAAPR